jgi:hypothetical protein
MPAREKDDNKFGSCTQTAALVPGSESLQWILTNEHKRAALKIPAE